MSILKKTVFESLDNAVKNGYLEELMSSTPRAIADDLYDKASDIGVLARASENKSEPGGGLERFLADELTPVVEEWLIAKKT